ncbi:RICIN domain-containing protein [Roseofilum sp. Guam]|uniref:RICIN domain-containing protein n=1 Tax=Roseofilum sp. Guam TaxID=2821502 RepID=UPI001B0ACD25|nr:RICIN domain-containing protein [Roseofilum sp. Guam]MBP0030843.1 RICIN domain-containing protein [Roseofilum sp. Guam]
MLKQLLGISLFSTIAISSSIVLAAPSMPRPDKNGDYTYVREADRWRVVDSEGLNCRSRPGTRFVVLEVKRPGAVLRRTIGSPSIRNDGRGLPWLLVEARDGSPCFVRANRRFIEPIAERVERSQRSSRSSQSTEGFLRNKLSGRCLDIAGRPGDAGPARLGGNAGSNAQIWDCSYDNPQQDDHVWVLNSRGYLIEKNSGHCLDVVGAPGTHNGANIALGLCEFSGYAGGAQTDQRWELLPGGYLRNKTSGRCIDVAGSPGVNNGANVQLTNCELSGNNHDRTRTDHRWEFVSR